MPNLYSLRDFFQTGRKVNGSYMGENEDVLNATYRNLSCLTDVEILSLRESARNFIDICNEVLTERSDCSYKNLNL